MARITDIVSNINKLGGLSQTNRFVVMITAPQSLGETRSFMYLCDTVALPGMQVTTQGVKHKGYGLAENRPNGFSFENLVCTFFVDNSGKTLTFFQKWMQLMFSFDSAHSRSKVNGVSSESFNYPSEYWGTISVFFKDVADDDIMVYTFEKCFPVDIGNIQLGWEQNDTIGRLPVNFTFRQYSTDATANTPSTNNINIDTNEFVDLNEVNRLLSSSNIPDVIEKSNINT